MDWQGFKSTIHIKRGLASYMEIYYTKVLWESCEHLDLMASDAVNQ